MFDHLVFGILETLVVLTVVVVVFGIPLADTMLRKN